MVGYCFHAFQRKMLYGLSAHTAAGIKGNNAVLILPGARRPSADMSAVSTQTKRLLISAERRQHCRYAVANLNARRCWPVDEPTHTDYAEHN